MDVPNTIALLTGVLGATFGGLSLWYARQSARASEVSALAARESVEYQIASSRTRNAANLIFVPAQNTEVQLQYRADTDKLTVALVLFNRGPADAHEVRVTLASEGVVGSSPSILLLRPLEKRRFEVTVPLTDPVVNEARELPLEVHSTDRNGRHRWQASLVITCATPSRLTARFAAGSGPTGIGIAVE